MVIIIIIIIIIVIHLFEFKCPRKDRKTVGGGEGVGLYEVKRYTN